MRLAVVFLLVASVSSAQSPSPQDRKPSRPVQNVDFRESEVGGTIVKPADIFVVVPERPIFKGLIQLRGSFARELARSVDAIP